MAETLREALALAVDQLTVAGVASPRADAETLAAHVLGVGRGELPLLLDDPAPTAFLDLVRQRAARVPLQHLTGVAYFRTVAVSVGPGVFVPRPETEVVVGHALGLIGSTGAEHPVVVDLGSGSGAIALAIATEAPHAEVHAVELDSGAHPWLRANLGPAQVTVHHADLADCLPEHDGRVDLVVSNPPYIPTGSVPRDPEVAWHDPPAALYSGEDGLDHIRRVATTASRLLRAGGWVVVEHADQQGDGVLTVFAEAGGWCDVQDHQDLTGRDRFVTARRAGPSEGV